MSEQAFEDGRRASILRAAEEVFADNSYEGASIRTIASVADVNPALIGYYFGNKSELYAKIIEGRYRDITAERLARLDAVPREARGHDAAAAILDAWFGPFFRRLNSPEDANFARMLAREANSPRDRARSVFSSFLDPSAHQCMDRLAAAFPEAHAQDIAWGYQFCIAVMMSSVTGADRVSNLAPDAARRDPSFDLLQAMITFASTGMAALAAQRGG